MLRIYEKVKHTVPSSLVANYSKSLCFAKKSALKNRVVFLASLRRHRQIESKSISKQILYLTTSQTRKYPYASSLASRPNKTFYPADETTQKSVILFQPTFKLVSFRIQLSLNILYKKLYLKIRLIINRNLWSAKMQKGFER